MEVRGGANRRLHHAWPAPFFLPRRTEQSRAEQLRGRRQKSICWDCQSARGTITLETNEGNKAAMGLELDGSVKEGDLGHLSLPLRCKYGSAA